MHTTFKIKLFAFFSNFKVIAALFLIVGIIAAIKQCYFQSYNNYLIFKYVYFHTINQTALYDFYPGFYNDQNHYGPLFSILIAPFAVLPDFLGTTLWNFTNAFFLIFAVNKLNLSRFQKCLILWLSLHEYLTSSLSFQFNPSIAAIIILSLVYVQNQKDSRAAFLIVTGTFIKLYGIVGLAFFLFSRNKVKFISSLILWSIILFLLPMLISSPEFIIQSYYDWFERLLDKNKENIYLSNMQDISLMGMLRKILNYTDLPNLPVIISGLIFFLLPYLKFNFYKDQTFSYLLLSSVLIFTVIFSTASESPTYIIAFVGVAIWFSIKEKPGFFDYCLLVFAVVVTSFSPSDLFPKIWRENVIKPYALKALPCFLIWLKIIWEMLKLESNGSKNKDNAEKVSLV